MVKFGKWMKGAVGLASVALTLAVGQTALALSLLNKCSQKLKKLQTGLESNIITLKINHLGPALHDRRLFQIVDQGNK